MRGMRSSPRAWGCFRYPREARVQVPVFPTCVGVFLPEPITFSWPFGLPHVRGGVSNSSMGIKRCRKSSPRAWGCFYVQEDDLSGGMVFPTCVGVFPALAAFSA